MSQVTIYRFEDAGGRDSSSYETRNYQEAKQHAQKFQFKIIAHNYEWADSELVADFTPKPDEEADDDEPEDEEGD